MRSISLRKIADRILTIGAFLALPLIAMTVWRYASAAPAVARSFLESRRLAHLADSIIDSRPTGSILGDGAAQTRLLAFIDYECPVCRVADSLLAPFLVDSASLGIVVLHFPLNNHPRAIPAAKGALCAERQGKFAAFHATLFTRGVPDDDSSLWTAARLAGIRDSLKFAECLQSASTAIRLERDIDFGRRLNVRSTPTFVGEAAQRMPFETIMELARGRGLGR